MKLYDFTTTEGLSYAGDTGHAEISTEQLFQGKPTLKVTNPRTLEAPEDKVPYVYGCYRVRVETNGMDFREYNRISFWIYPEVDLYKQYLVSVELRNEGEVVYPRKGYLEGCHFVTVEGGKWNQVVWEIPDVYRDKVSYVQINFEMFGRQKGMTENMTAYISTMELEQTEVSKYKGWDSEGEIVVCHSGYEPKAEKIACASGIEEKQFQLVDADTKQSVWEGTVKEVESDLGTFYVMDFSEVTEKGTYYIACGEKQSYPFAIREDVWVSAAEKTQNFFYTQRCGVEVEGIHKPCHLDCYISHPNGKELPIAGGWHDAADLSQGNCNTAEAAHAFLDAAAALKEKNPKVARKMLEEAKHGMDWILATRFGDGYRVGFYGISVWTEGDGNSEKHYTSPATDKPFENLCAAAAEAAATMVFADSDKAYAEKCLQAAKEDFSFALTQIESEGYQISKYYLKVQEYAEIVFAAVLLYKATKDRMYLEKGAFYARKVMACQQTELTDWKIPFVGFFYEDEKHENTLNYNHRSHEQVIIAALAGMMEIAENHEDCNLWKQSLMLYREYILKLKEFAEPYGVLPSGIYFKSKPVALLGYGSMSYMETERYVRQLESGVALSEDAYLRRFPVVSTYRGCFGVQLSKAKAVTQLGKALHDEKMLQIGEDQLRWIVGRNPFNRSYMYGEGHNYPHMYNLFTFDNDGAIPVGMQSLDDTDVPYMPMTADATYFEVWVHPVSRFLWTAADLF